MKYFKCIFIQSFRCYSKRNERFKSLISPSTEKRLQSSLSETLYELSQKKSYLRLAGVTEQILKAAEYNRKLGINPSGIIMLHCYDFLNKEQSTTQDGRDKIGLFDFVWALEMLHSYNLLWDKQTVAKSDIDVMPGDAGLLRCCLYDILEENCEDNKDISQFFDKGFQYGAIGSYLDNYLKIKGKSNKFADFKPKAYDNLCEFKTAYNTFKLPFNISLYITRNMDSIVNDTIEKICSDLSKLYQIQGEFEDCFGEESKEFRSSGTDIQDGKCTWLAVSALQRCTSAQRVVFNACYGSHEPAHIERIKLLYEQLKIPQLYREEEGSLCESIMQRAEIIESAGIPLVMFKNLLDVMFQEKI